MQNLRIGAKGSIKRCLLVKQSRSRHERFADQQLKVRAMIPWKLMSLASCSVAFLRIQFEPLHRKPAGQLFIGSGVCGRR